MQPHRPFCDGMNRRSALRVGLGATLGGAIGLPQLLAAQSNNQFPNSPDLPPEDAAHDRRLSIAAQSRMTVFTGRQVKQFAHRNQRQNFGVLIQSSRAKREARQDRSAAEAAGRRHQVDRRRGSAVDDDRWLPRLANNVRRRSIQQPIQSDSLWLVNLNVQFQRFRTAHHDWLCEPLRPFGHDSINTVLVRADNHAAKRRRRAVILNDRVPVNRLIKRTRMKTDTLRKTGRVDDLRSRLGDPGRFARRA